MTTLVTGALGNIGSAVIGHLQALGHDVRVADIDLDALRAAHPDAAPTRLDFTDPTTFPDAVAGVDRLFLVRPPAVARVGPTVNRFLDTAAAARVEHVVFSSVAGADTNPIVPHHRIERHLRASGMRWTMLRPGFFAQNLDGAYRTDIRDHDRIVVPSGEGRAAFVDTRDIAEVAAMALDDPDTHAATGYVLTGPDALSFREVADTLTVELGRPIRYEPASIIGYLRHLGRHGMPVTQRLVQTVLHVGLRRGDAEAVDPTLGRLLGRPPTTLRAHVRDHAHLWAHQTTAT